MSRSCHSAMSSKAACTLARTTRARPQICSQVTGLRLCGMAELPFWPRAKYSSASRTSVRCRWRTSRAIFSHSAVASASAATNCGVPVALDHLRGHRRGLQAQPRADPLLGFRTDVARTCPPRRRSCRRAVLRPRRRSARQIAPGFLVPDGQLEAESDRLGVHAVRAADLHGVLEFQRAPFQHGAQLLQAGSRMRRGLLQQQRLRGIHHVVRRQAVMQPARRFGVAGGGHGLRHGGGEGDHVVLHLASRFRGCARRRSRRAARSSARRFGGNHAQFGQRFGGRQLHFQPLLKFVLVAPDPAHFGPRVSGNHVT